MGGSLEMLITITEYIDVWTAAHSPKTNFGKGANGWGALAKELGIKPGSEEFHVLKGGHDLRSGTKMAKFPVVVEVRIKTKKKVRGKNRLI